MLRTGETGLLGLTQNLALLLGGWIVLFSSKVFDATAYSLPLVPTKLIPLESAKVIYAIALSAFAAVCLLLYSNWRVRSARLANMESPAYARGIPACFVIHEMLDSQWVGSIMISLTAAFGITFGYCFKVSIANVILGPAYITSVIALYYITIAHSNLRRNKDMIEATLLLIARRNARHQEVKEWNRSAH